MNQTSFEKGDRVRHKLTQIQGKIVQMEEFLAMPHAWVIEPSVCEFNPHTLYRLVDSEKVEEQEDKHTLTQELLEDIVEASACDQFNLSKCNGSTLNKCDADLLSFSNEVLRLG